MLQSNHDLEKFLKPFPFGIQDIANSLRDFVKGLYPTAHELVYDNYKAVAIGFSISDKSTITFCSIAVYQDHVSFGLNFAHDIADPKGLFQGDATQYKRMVVADETDFPKAYIKRMLAEAHGISMKQLLQDKQLIRKIALPKPSLPVKRRPRKNS